MFFFLQREHSWTKSGVSRSRPDSRSIGSRSSVPADNRLPAQPLWQASHLPISSSPPASFSPWRVCILNVRWHTGYSPPAKLTQSEIFTCLQSHMPTHKFLIEKLTCILKMNLEFGQTPWLLSNSQGETHLSRRKQM